MPLLSDRRGEVTRGEKDDVTEKAKRVSDSRGPYSKGGVPPTQGNGPDSSGAKGDSFSDTSSVSSHDSSGQRDQDLSSAVEAVGESLGQAAQQVGEGAGRVAGEVGEGTGQAAGELGEGAGQAAQAAGEGAGQAAQDAGKSVGQAAQDAGKGAVQAAEGAGDAVQGVGDTADNKEAPSKPETAGKGDGTLNLSFALKSVNGYLVDRNFTVTREGQWATETRSPETEYQVPTLNFRDPVEITMSPPTAQSPKQETADKKKAPSKPETAGKGDGTDKQGISPGPNGQDRPRLPEREPGTADDNGGPPKPRPADELQQADEALTLEEAIQTLDRVGRYGAILLGPTFIALRSLSLALGDAAGTYFLDKDKGKQKAEQLADDLIESNIPLVGTVKGVQTGTAEVAESVEKGNAATAKGEHLAASAHYVDAALAALETATMVAADVVVHAHGSGRIHGKVVDPKRPKFVPSKEVGGPHERPSSPQARNATPTLPVDSAVNPPQGQEARATYIHDRYSESIVGQKLNPETFLLNENKNKLEARVADHYDKNTRNLYEFNTTPWSELPQDKLRAKVNEKIKQVAKDLDLRESGKIQEAIWYGTEALPDTGPASELKRALEGAGIKYKVVPLSPNLAQLRVPVY